MTAPAGRGATVIADEVVRKIARQAATEALPTGAPSVSAGSAAIHGRTAQVSLRVALPYPAPLAEDAHRLQRHVASRTAQLTGLDITSSRLVVTRLTAGGTPPAAAPAEAPITVPPVRTPRRRWSPRSVPATLLILAIWAACAAVTAELVRVRLLDLAPAVRRIRAVDWIADHHAGDFAVGVGALAAVAVGAWLLVSAVTPGRRRELTVVPLGPRLTATIDRSTVAALVRDAVGEVEDISVVSVRAGRRRLTVRARSASGDTGEARRQAVAATERILSACRLRRTLRHRVSVTPDPAWRPPRPATALAPDAPKGPAR
ncbi:DUF6286 domain-containing protein [Streptomyces sp. NPDC097619]|uniref:DUF6286 domain-containing Asp23/Gls24 family envelope stress response protein n=1 Tax=Streptomyces sp. NPDC097619 TaxID=3157228 RepID=UPI00332ACCA2